MSIRSWMRDKSVLLAAIIFGLATVGTFLALLLKISNSSLAPATVLSRELGYAVVNLAFISVGTLMIWKRPENRVSWLFGIVGLSLALVELSDQYALYAYRHEVAGGDLAAWLASWIWAPAFGPIGTFLLLWFPDGRVPGPRWRVLEKFAWGLVLSMSLLVAFAQDPEASYPNPAAINWVTDLVQVAFPIISIAFPIVVLLGVASLVVRFRRARGDVREQLKWFVFAAAFMGLYMLMATMLDLDPDTIQSRVAEVVAFVMLPVSVGIAILRYRLYDIDVIINRALVYGVLTAALLASYLLVVVTLSRVLDPVTQDSDVAVAASTLAVATLFRPFRRRIQGFIDRRFYRRKYDSAEALKKFSARLRDEIEVDIVRSDILGVVQNTLQPRHVSVWLKVTSK